MRIVNRYKIEKKDKQEKKKETEKEIGVRIVNRYKE